MLSINDELKNLVGKMENVRCDGVDCKKCPYYTEEPIMNCNCVIPYVRLRYEGLKLGKL